MRRIKKWFNRLKINCMSDNIIILRSYIYKEELIVGEGNSVQTEKLNKTLLKLNILRENYKN